ncbi:MAG: alginate lyase family protein [Bacteroidales bacterium]|nr:alginate lyase family protein [Bacteroidales bacterium]
MNKYISALLLIFISVAAAAQMVFQHPAALNSKAELDFVKLRLKAGDQPWTAEFTKLKLLATTGSKALTYVNSNTDEAEYSRDEARKVYANALCWYLMDDETYAHQAVAILNDWSGLQGFNGGNDQDKLLAGWLGALFGPAAEIMRTYPGWAPADIGRFQSMFRRAFYPQLNTASSWNGNVDLTQIDAMINISVFNEDEAEFKLAVERFNKRILSYFYLESDSIIPSIEGDVGNIDEFWSYPAKWVDGLTQETCRDNNHHSQYALASALHAAEAAWHQGVDLYTPNTKRFTDAMELMALQINTGNMQGICKDNTSTSEVFNTWEIGYNHYHLRKGISLPYTNKLIWEKVRVESTSDWNIFFETLTHAEVGN